MPTEPDAHSLPNGTAYRYESITNRPAGSMISRAEAVLKDGWVKRGQPNVRLDEPIPWDSAAGGRSWIFALHCLDMIEALLCAHDETGRARYLEAALDVGLDWVRRCADDKRGERFPFAWYDMAVGLRVYRLAYLFDAGTASGLLTKTDAEVIAASIADHLIWLADDTNIAFHSNHGYYQVAGQLAAARRCKGAFATAHRSERQARRRLARLVDTQFASDGCHLEHSPDYHRMVLDTLRGLIRASLDPDGTLASVADRSETALAWFVAPNGHLVNFGDSDDRDVTTGEKKAAMRWKTPAMQHAASGGAIGSPPPGTQRAFAEGGYFIVHERAKRSYLALTACFHSRTHKQADDLSFVWHEHGRPLLIDAGRYGYVEPLPPTDPLREQGFWYGDPNRRYCESTRAHNALTFDGRDTARVGVRPYGSALSRWARTTDGVHLAEARVRQHGVIEHTRRLALAPGAWLMVVDRWDDGDAMPRVATQWFHFAPDIEVVADEDGRSLRATAPDSALRLRVRTTTADGKLGSPVRGQLQPELQGWWSPAERRMEAATAFNVTHRPSPAGTLTTVFDLGTDAPERWQTEWRF